MAGTRIPHRRPKSPTAALSALQLEALQLIKDGRVRYVSVPGRPGQGSYRTADGATVPTRVVLTLHNERLIKHGDRQHNGPEWFEPVGATMQGDQVLRRGAAGAAKTAKKKEDRARVAAARAAAALLPPPEVDVVPLVAQVPGAGRVWVLSVPPVKLLNANDRRIWQAKRPLVENLRAIGKKLATAARIPRLRAAHIFYVVHLNTHASKGDPANWYDSAKALLDGIVDAGALPDDSDGYVIGPDPRTGPRFPLSGGRLSIVIIELPEGIPA